jgi:hypothetical protein
MSIFDTVLLCDHVLLDENRKPSAIGIYSGDIIVSELPAILNLALLIIFTPKQSGKFDIKLQFLMEEEPLTSGILSVDGVKEGQSSALRIPGLQIQTRVDAVFEAKAALPGGELQTIIKKRIFKGPSPGANELLRLS